MVARLICGLVLAPVFAQVDDPELGATLTLTLLPCSMTPDMLTLLPGILNH